MRPVKALLMDTVWASLFSPQNFGKDVYTFWRIFSKWVGSNHNMNSGLFSVVARVVAPNGKGSAFAYRNHFDWSSPWGCDSLVDGLVENKGQLLQAQQTQHVTMQRFVWQRNVAQHRPTQHGTQVCRYLLRSSCLVCAGLRGAMLKAAVDAGRRAFNQSGCKVCKA